MASSASTAGTEPVPRPKMRIVEKPPQGGRPKHQPSMTFRPEISTNTTASTSKTTGATVTQPPTSMPEPELQPPPPAATIAIQRQTTRSIRPLPSVPQLHASFHNQPVPHSAPVTASTQSSLSTPVTPRPFVRPLPPTPGPSLPTTAAPALANDVATPPQTQAEGNAPGYFCDLTSEALVQAPVLIPIEPLRVISRASRMPSGPPKESPSKGPKAPPPPLDLPPVGLDRNPTPPPPTTASAHPFMTSDVPTTVFPASSLLSSPSQGPICQETRSASKHPDGGSTHAPSRSVSLPSPLPSMTPKRAKDQETAQPATSSMLPSPGELDADDVRAARLLEEFMSKPDRGHELMMLASKMSRLWSPTRTGSPPPLVDGVGEWEVLTEMKRESQLGLASGSKTKAKSKSHSRSHSKSKSRSGDGEASRPPPVPPKPSRRPLTSLSAPAAALLSSLDPAPRLPQTAPGNVPSSWPSSEKSMGIPRIVPFGDKEDDSQPASPSSKFLETLAPSKRYTVLTIISSIAEESILASLPNPDDSGSESDYDAIGGEHDEGVRTSAVDPTVDRKATEIGMEFAKKTGKAAWAPRLIKRLSKKWVREKKGKRWVEDDYSNVLGFLRRL